MGDEAVADFLAAEHGHWHAAARVDAASGEEEVLVFLALLRGFEGLVEFPVADDAVDRAGV